MAQEYRVSFARPYFGPEGAAAAAEAVRSGWVVGGPRLAEFEQRFAAVCGAAYAVGMSSWTTGAFLAARVRPDGSLDRNGPMEALDAEGIPTRRGVMASHLEPPDRSCAARLPATKRAAAECVQLPMHAGMSGADADTVIAALERICSRTRFATRLAR